MDNASDYGSEDSRFDSWLARLFLRFSLLYLTRPSPRRPNDSDDSVDVFPSLTVHYPRCSVCSGVLAHVVQVYCPLEGSPYHRTINVFACPSPACYGNSLSWKVLRSQCLESEIKPDRDCEAKKAPLTVPMANRDWCEGADDWGVDEDQGTTGFSPSLPAGAAPAPPQASASDRSVSSRLQGLSLEEEMREGEGLVLSGPVPAFQPYYMDVLAEEGLCAEDDMAHAQELLSEYEKREGVVLEDLLSCDAGGEVEKYEKTKARHGDKEFFRFMKTISLCPGQVLRYCWNGQPVFITCPPSHMQKTVPPCAHCGSPRIFEFQLMPALVSMLRGANEDDWTVEFGIVLIYTCRDSCWPSRNQTPVEEFPFVQADPDQKLFR
ncbi:programmed cell death protein 2-like isoform X2 [Lepisosteus oculatus]|uniref:programmed cell death protein 2-like isoform X2 n=1 Tax=Lepisosteus oculatus TaxID=7918 RepID=UPI0035F50187